MRTGLRQDAAVDGPSDEPESPDDVQVELPRGFARVLVIANEPPSSPVDSELDRSSLSKVQTIQRRAILAGNPTLDFQPGITCHEVSVVQMGASDQLREHLDRHQHAVEWREQHFRGHVSRDIEACDRDTRTGVEDGYSSSFHD